MFYDGFSNLIGEQFLGLGGGTDWPFGSALSVSVIVLLLALGQLLAEPGHRPVEAVKPGASAQDLLREALSKAVITKFELMEPSLEEIFIRTVGESVDA